MGVRAFAVLALASCYIEPDPPAIANYAFVTSATTTGSTVGGLEGADAMCRAAAHDAGLAGTYVAWLASDTGTAISRLAAASGWRRTDGNPFANTPNDILTGHMFYPLRLDEHGNDVITDGSSEIVVATGTHPDGSVGSYCSNFTGAGKMLVGVPDGTTGAWTYDSEIDCGNTVRLYCFGTDLKLAVAPEIADGRLAFLSKQAFTPGGGIATADAVCAQEASDAGRTGEFLALLATDQIVGARFPHGAPWVRPDGIVVSTDLSSLSAPVNVTLDGAYSNTTTWTGAPSFSEVNATQTCGNWTSTLGGGLVGEAARSSHRALFVTSGEACTAPHRVYCFQK